MCPHPQVTLKLHLWSHANIRASLGSDEVGRDISWVRQYQEVTLYLEPPSVENRPVLLDELCGILF